MEDYPFEDGTFDAALGVAFMHFIDQKTALQERRRVVKPGGIVASSHPLKYDYNVSFFREWFQPVFELAAKCKEYPKSFFLLPDDIPKAFGTAELKQIEVENFNFQTVFTDPEKVIGHFIHDVGLFQEEMIDLPWKAREELIEMLKKTVAAVCQKYSQKERTIQAPSQNIKGKGLVL